MISVGMICDVRDNKVIGVVGVEREDVAFSTKNDFLYESLGIILNNKLYLDIDKTVDNSTCSIKKEVKSDGYLLMGINESLPFPWKILGAKKVEGDIEEVVNNTYSYVEGLNNEQENS